MAPFGAKLCQYSVTVDFIIELDQVNVTLPIEIGLLPAPTRLSQFSGHFFQHAGYHLEPDIVSKQRPLTA